MVERSELSKKAKIWEVETFPGCFSREWAVGDMYGPEGDPYFYFGPSWHVDMNLINEEIIDDLKKNGKSVLSVGSGRYGFLERFLTDYCGVDKDKVVLSDNVGQFPDGFTSYKFDFTKEWPDVGRDFDYVLMPESILLSTRFDLELPNHIVDRLSEDLLSRVVKSSYGVLEPSGQLRMSGLYGVRFISSVEEVVRQKFPKARMKYEKSLLLADMGE